MKYYKFGHGKWRKSVFIAQYEQYMEKIEKQRKIANKQFARDFAEIKKLANTN